MVLKYETLGKDLKFLREALGLPYYIVEKVLKRSKSFKAQKAIEWRRKKYYQQLSTQQMARLKSVYLRDFYLFNYLSSGYQ